MPGLRSLFYQNITQTNTSNQVNPSICFDENNIPHLAWNNKSLNSDDNNLTYGAGFNPSERIITNTTIESKPQIISDLDGAIHIIWNDIMSGDERVFHISYNGTWNNVEQISNDGPLGDFNPASAIDSEGNLYVIWGAAYTFNQYLNYKVLNTSTGSWSSAKSVETSQFGSDPDIAIDDSDNIHVVWLNDTSSNDNDVLYRRFNAAEETWSSTQLVSTNSLNYASDPMINIDSDGTIKIVWIDQTNYYLNSGQDNDIFMSRLTISEVPFDGGPDNLIPGYNFYFLIAVLGIASLLLFKKFQS